jgi:L-methionine (R)-S-oxide reductase
LAEQFDIDKNQSIQKQYEDLTVIIKSLIDKNDNIITSLSNTSAAIKQTFDKMNWVGFYLYDGKKLYLGPFQGKVACTSIEIGKGVCGSAAFERKTILVSDVDKFPDT